MKIYIKKFKRIENLTIEFPSILKGANGIGKTSILEAISFCLVGKNLNGKEFIQIYDNRQKLKDAFADVSFFDNYGNEFRRVVAPVFQTNRQGEEKLKTLKYSECWKNGIIVPDFSSDFKSFLTFGTDYFFNQKEDVQRAIVINSLRNKMPHFPFEEKQKELAECKKEQKKILEKIKNLNIICDYMEEILPENKKIISEFLMQKIEIEREKITKERSNLLDIDGKIIFLESEINNFYKKLNEFVSVEFSEKIKIEIQTKEYIIGKDDYKECFKFIADGKIFPSECNDALINNVKLQILRNLQRLNGYNGITLTDKCEGNTTQKIETNGMNVLLAFATFDKNLKIEKTN